MAKPSGSDPGPDRFGQYGAAKVDKSHKRHVKDTNPTGLYSGTAVRNAIEDGEFFPGGERLRGVEPMGKSKKK